MTLLVFDRCILKHLRKTGKEQRTRVKGLQTSGDVMSSVKDNIRVSA